MSFFLSNTEEFLNKPYCHYLFSKQYTFMYIGFYKIIYMKKWADK